MTVTYAPAMERLFSALDEHGCRPRRQGDAVAARCPVHDDRHPSLSVSRSREVADKVTVVCHAGCEDTAVLDALGLDVRDLYDEPREARSRLDLTPVRLGDNGTAQAVNGTEQRRLIAEYVYRDADGAELFRKVRYEPKDFRVKRPDGRAGWHWNLGEVEPVLYRLPDVRAGIADGRTVYVVEGEKDADRLAALGEVATCNYDGASPPGKRAKWRHAYTEALRGADVVVIADRDDAGRAHAAVIAAELAEQARSVRVAASATTAEHDDVTDHLDAGHDLGDLVTVDVSDEAEQTRQAQHDRKVSERLDYLRVQAEAQQQHQAEQRATRPSLREKMLNRRQLAEIPPLMPLIGDTLDLGTLGMLAGPYGSCKSFVALSWVASVATGTPWQGREIAAPGPVLYVAGEGSSGIHGRLAAWEADTGVTIPEDRLVVVPDSLNLGATSDVDEVCALVAELRPSLVVFETLNRCAVGLEENSATDMGRVVESMNRVLNAMDRNGSVFVVHHAGKDGTLRGSTALAAGMDTVYLTKGDAQAFTLWRDKRKDGAREDELPMRLRLVEDSESGVVDLVRTPGHLVTNDERLLSAFVSTFSATGASKAELRAVADMAPASFNRSLNNLVKRGALVNHGTTKRPFYQLGVTGR